MRSGFKVGELTGIDPGYNGGIWLRPQSGMNISADIGHVHPDGLLVVIEIDEKSPSRDYSIKVVSSCGKVGWTFISRLKKLDLQGV